jgi:Fe-S cluster assembly protein SufD
MTELSSPCINFSETSFDEFLETRREPAWLLSLRRAAWQTYCDGDWPTRSDEEWMRTDLRSFRLERFAPPMAGGGSLRVDGLLSRNVELAGNVASADGSLVEQHLADEVRQQGVLFGDWESMLEEHGDLLRPYLEKPLVESSYDKFASLHAAYWTGGRVLYVPRGIVIKQPLHSISAMGDGKTDLGRTLVILEEGAEATLLTETASSDESATGFHCGCTEIYVGPRARLRFVNLQNWGLGVWHFSQQRVRVGRDASLQWTTATLGARLSQVNQHVVLAEPGAESQVNGVLFTEGKQHATCNSLQHHAATDCRSDFLYKSALQDTSRTVWRGMIKVDQCAQRTDGYQRNDNLLLSTRARADSIPGLEIEADDVRCTHGSTSGRVDEELIFYLQCRGFTRKEAIRTVVTGFFQQIFDRITIESVREAMSNAIARRVRDYE